MEEHQIYTIPSNFIDSGRILNGLLKTRNAIEAALAIMIGYVILSMIPFTSASAKITVLIAVLGPVAIVFLVGINGEPASRFFRSLLQWQFTKGIMIYDQKAPPLVASARDAREKNKPVFEKLKDSYRSWKNEREERQLEMPDLAQITVVSDPYTDRINRLFASSQNRENGQRETNVYPGASSHTYSEYDAPPVIELDDDTLGGGFDQ